MNPLMKTMTPFAMPPGGGRMSTVSRVVVRQAPRKTPSKKQDEAASQEAENDIVDGDDDAEENPATTRPLFSFEGAASIDTSSLQTIRQPASEAVCASHQGGCTTV